MMCCRQQLLKIILQNSCDADITKIIVIGTGERDEILSKKSGKQEQYRLCDTSTTIPEACRRKETFVKIESKLDICSGTCRITVNINMMKNNVDRYSSRDRTVLRNGTV